MADVKSDDVDNIELVYNAECGFCGEVIGDSIDKFEYDSINEAIADSLNSFGWQMIDSDKFGGVYLSCANCAELDDNERGDED